MQSGIANPVASKRENCRIGPTRQPERENILVKKSDFRIFAR
jgi:hypothetical protein